VNNSTTWTPGPSPLGRAPRSSYRRYLAQPDLTATPPGRLASLTDREREVLALVAAGLSNHEIAQHLVVSPATRKTHITRAMTKLDAHDRAQLVIIAYETRLVRPSPMG
jgi:DNA-binding NarL/FixJ family response regulator